MSPGRRRADSGNPSSIAQHGWIPGKGDGVMAGDRIRVLIAGNIYAQRALVRRFLEDDGYEVVGEAPDREDMVSAIRRKQPDAVVIDDELLGGGTMGRVRRAAPDAKVVVFTSSPANEEASRQDADGVLEKGLALSSLSALLGRLFSEPALTAVSVSGNGHVEGAETVDLDATVASGTGLAGAAASGPSSSATALEETGGPERSDDRRHNLGRVAAITGGVVLIVWGLVAMLVSGGEPGTGTRALDPTDTTGGGVVEPTPEGATPLDTAYAYLDELTAALEDGNYVLATVTARTVMDLREEAFDAGFSVTGLDAAITARLEALVAGLPLRVNASLEEILGALYPTIEPVTRASGDGSTRLGGGSGVVLGAAGAGPADGDGAAPADEGPVVGGASGAGDRGGSSGGPGGSGAGSGGSGGGTNPTFGPGDGRAWGQSHGQQGGWPGHPTNPPNGSENADPSKRDRTGSGKPPWAGGR